MIRNILALIDFSCISNRIVKQAGDLAQFYGAKCWLMHVATPDPEFVGYEVGPDYIRESRAEVISKEEHKLQVYKQKLENENVRCDYLLIKGQINPTIEAEIKKLEIDMIVLGSHGRSRLYDFLVGSVCEYMLRRSVVPMVIIPNETKINPKTSKRTFESNHS